GIVGLRPWTRMECARLVQEADDLLRDDAPVADEARKIEESLAEEFAPESSRLGGGSNFDAGVDRVYTRFTGISGAPLRDGYHFGQTVINDFVRPYAEGA